MRTLHCVFTALLAVLLIQPATGAVSQTKRIPLKAPSREQLTPVIGTVGTVVIARSGRIFVYGDVRVEPVHIAVQSYMLMISRTVTLSFRRNNRNVELSTRQQPNAQQRFTLNVVLSLMRRGKVDPKVIRDVVQTMKRVGKIKALLVNEMTGELFPRRPKS